MSWDGLRGSGVTYADSRVDSDRFDLRIARATVGYEAGAEAADELAKLLADSNDDIVVVRYPTELSACAAALATCERVALNADTLMYWEVPSADLARTGRGESDGLGVVGARDLPAGAPEQAVSAVVADSFSGYGNHYTADPLLDPELALRGYNEWALATLHADPSNVLLLVAEQRNDPTPIGVATLAAGDEGRDVEIQLAGLIGRSQGRGRYGRLLAGVGLLAAERGAERVIISTQAHNVRVQRAWARAGFRPYACVSTVHAIRPGLLQGTG